MENNNANRPTKPTIKLTTPTDRSTQASIDFHFHRQIQIESKSKKIDSQKVLKYKHSHSHFNRNMFNHLQKPRSFA